MAEKPYSDEMAEIIALDRTLAASENWDKRIATLSLVEKDPELREAARMISEQLGDFYQKVGEEVARGDEG